MQGARSGLGLLTVAFAFGLRHGVDWDHLAALGDVARSEPDRRRALWLSTHYALGHAAVVFALGFVAIVVGAELPDAVDGAMTRFVGATLAAMGLWVLVTLVQNRPGGGLPNRGMVVVRAVRRLRGSARGPHAGVVIIDHDHVHDHAGLHGHQHGDADHAASGRVAVAHTHRHRHVGRGVDESSMGSGAGIALVVGLIHGVGVETPTQVVLFASAAGADGRGAGVVVLAAFIVGLLTTNTVMAVTAVFGIGQSRRRWLDLALGATTATFSLVVGGLYLVGASTALPAFFGG